MASLEVSERWQREIKDFFVRPAGLLPDRAMAPLTRYFIRTETSGLKE
jgi:hypothetical protein